MSVRSSCDDCIEWVCLATISQVGYLARTVSSLFVLLHILAMLVMAGDSNVEMKSMH